MVRSELACAVTALLVLSTVASPVVAQQAPWWQRPTRDQPVREDPVRLPSDAAERDAARLYAEARVDLDADRHALAQRKLELLVAKHPMSALAEVARRDLQRLYATASPSAPAPAVPASPPSQRAVAATPTGGLATVGIQSAVPLAPSQAAPTVASPITQAAVRIASEDFRQQAGDRVFFADGSTDLGGRARQALEAQATWLNRHTDVKVVIEGHADDQGSRDFNRQMAEKRAEVVRLRLNDLGVNADRMQISAHGRNEPVADCAESSCKLQNRRVVTVIVHVPKHLGFDASGRRALDAAASVVGQPAPSRAP